MEAEGEEVEEVEQQEWKRLRPAKARYFQRY
jgi:hypothetical protein